MKPASGQDISTDRAAPLHGGDVEPLSSLAAASPDQRAELFAFTDEDQALFEEVLANDAAAEDPEDQTAGA